jgi:phosphorylase/glycogen(starch) synthase
MTEKDKKTITPDCIFEVSWEVCNKIGGIHTVIATKARNLSGEFGDKHILIGPDMWRDSGHNPEFLEDISLLNSWRAKAASEGLRIKVGRWKDAGESVAILVDFSSYITRKDDILTDFWTKYKLDSISGQWDYIESALFGYASGKVIESYVRFNLPPSHKAVAQFHEWMTGAGILYLKSTNLPVATVFTTHATVVGRSIASNNLPLYGSFQRYNADDKAREFNVMAKHSLEKISARQADIFTTVSDITAAECNHFLGRAVDIITPNGFENSLIPSEEDFGEYRQRAKEKLIATAGLMTGIKPAEDVVIMGISGRYEYKNKGIDIFLDSLGRLNNNKELEREVLAFLFVPAGNNGPDKELLNKVNTGSGYITNCTHILNDPEWDPVTRRIRELHLDNKQNDKVKVLFVPAYLNGNDGVINIAYYQLLSGLDLTVFPSYYEPWGYTPLESLAFGVPTITTTLAGFGLWVKNHCSLPQPGIEIIEREDNGYEQVINSVEAKMLEIAMLPLMQMKKYRENAKEISLIALWENQIKYYKTAYSMAIEKVVKAKGAFPYSSEDNEHVSLKTNVINKPFWSTIFVNKQLPERLKTLDVISRNLWWSWNEPAVELFKSIDEELWYQCNCNPMEMLDKIPLKRYNKLEKDTKFLKKLDRLNTLFMEYMKEKEEMKDPHIAYFSMEYGLERSLKIYSGGLGILAGDYLKESSDKMVKITGIGLLYRYGYFTQLLSAQGDQVVHYEAQDFLRIPVTPVRDDEGNWKSISIALPGRNLHARLWRVDVGRTELYLMDTDYEENLPEDRSVTHHLYGGDWENRLKQEMLLGIGGIRALRTLGIKAGVYHCNEGHAAFTGLERLREYIQQENLSFTEALEVVRSSSLFTTHTPVPAGHDSFQEDLLRSYMSHYPGRLKISWEVFIAFGKSDPSDKQEKFSMSNLAANLSQEINGVSKLHGKVSREILSPLWPGYLPEELHVSYVTNGVHYPTWTASEWKKIHSEVFGEDFSNCNYPKSCFEGIYKVDNERIWDTRNRLRTRLVDYIKHSLSDPLTNSHYAPHHLVTIREALRDDILTIGFARRFATYKRAYLLFSDLDRLDSVINNPERPVQFVFAGKAHPADKAGQDMIRRIVEVSIMPRFIGKIVFIPGYDINVAKILVQGVDIWMNTPSRPLEASGTSGEKAVMNGALHFSVLDGWWVEGYQEGAGWALPQESTYKDQNFQDELDAATIYNMLENEITPLFYKRDEEKGIPVEWTGMIKNSIAKIASNFTTNRMMSDYQEKFYIPLAKRTMEVVESDYSMARELAFWKKRVRREWDRIEVRSYKKPDDSKSEMSKGNQYIAEVELVTGELLPEEIGVEMLFAEADKAGRMTIISRYDFELKGFENGIAKYRCVLIPESAGVYNFAARIYPNNPKLPHRQDFDLVRWL